MFFAIFLDSYSSSTHNKGIFAILLYLCENEIPKLCGEIWNWLDE